MELLNELSPSVKSKGKPARIISDAEAEVSASEWAGSEPSPIKNYLKSAILDPKQHRDIGKLLANTTEIVVANELLKLFGRPFKLVSGESYDAITDDDGLPIRVQIKFRMDGWHFETTRRNSIKNAGTNSTGHIAYSANEFDLLAIFKPSRTFGITGSVIRFIPVTALINPLKTNQLITHINAKLRKEYDNDDKTLEIVNSLSQTLV